MMESTARPKVVFISGHTDLTQDEFDRIYVRMIEIALANGDDFILGDAKGVDTQALTYLLSNTVKGSHPRIEERITVYASRGYNIDRLESMGVTVIGPNDAKLTPTPEIRRWIGIEDEGSNKARYRHLVRDTHMTLNSDYDILHVRDEKESRKLYGERYRVRMSATEHNRQRRERFREQARLQISNNLTVQT